MTEPWVVADADLAALRRLAQLVALKARAGDVICLRGDLGAGKTTFSRFLVRALLGDPTADVPSPTFPILQTYAAPRFAVSHFDFYRLSGIEDLEDVGFYDALSTSLVIAEWPERVEAALPGERLDIEFSTSGSETTRRVALTATGELGERLARTRVIDGFLSASGHAGPDDDIRYLQGDASARAYARVVAPGQSLVLMDAPRTPDGPPVLNGMPYSRIANLAEDIRPFVAVGRALEARGLSVPHIQAADLEHGLLLLEDLGDLSFGRAISQGLPQAPMWLAAVDALAALRADPIGRDLPMPDGQNYRLPRFDRAALEIEINLILDWYWPAVKGSAAPDNIRAEFLDLWSPVLSRMLAAPPGLFLRDYHSPNLFWLPERQGVRRVGIIDFQDALAEHWAYDLVSLLQDARVDVPPALEAEGISRYVASVSAAEPGFNESEFRSLYAAFGAQRNTRLVGLWVRLLKRDGKPGYLQHMPRTWNYVARNLAHPSLSALAQWYDRHFPEAVRKQAITA